MAVLSILSKAAGWSYGDKQVAITEPEEDIQTKAIDGGRIPMIVGRTIGGGAIAAQWHIHGKTSTLLRMCEGPISSIATAKYNGNDTSDYGTTDTTRLGTRVQSQIPGFSKDLVTTSLNTQMGTGVYYTYAAVNTFNKISYTLEWITGVWCKRWDVPWANDYGYSVDYKANGAPSWINLVTFNGLIQHQAPMTLNLTADLPSESDWDIRIGAWGTHNPTATQDMWGKSEFWADAWIKEFNEWNPVGATHPNTALLAVEDLASDQMGIGDDTFSAVVEGYTWHEMSSATAVGAPAYTRNPADIMLGLVHHRLSGGSRFLDTRFKVTAAWTTTAWTVGETVHGPGDHDTVYIFKGIVRSVSGTTVVVESLQGVPHGAITGQTSARVGTISSIDHSYAIDMSGLWDARVESLKYSPDGSAVTTVDVNSAAGQKILSVAATAQFTAGDVVLMNYEGDRHEYKTIDTIQDGISLTFTANLTYTHTLAQADKVSVAERRHFFDYEYKDERGSLWEGLWKIARACRMLLWMRGGRIMVKSWKDETPAQVFSMGNIVPGSFKIHHFSEGNKPNRIRTAFRNELYSYRKWTATVKEPDADSGGERFMMISQPLPGVTRAGQAMREGWWFLKRRRYVRHHIEFEVGLQGLMTDVGRVFSFQHDLPGTATAGGKVVSATGTTITFDHPVTISGGESVLVKHSDDTEESKAISDGAGTYTTVTVAAWGTTPARHEDFIVGTPGRYRCMAKRPTVNQRFVIQAEEDIATLYSDNCGAFGTFSETTLPDPDDMPDDVTNLTLTEVNVHEGGAVQNKVSVSWQHPDTNVYKDAEVWWRPTFGASSDWGKRQQDGETLADHHLLYPQGVCSDSAGNIYICDTQNHRILKMTYVGKWAFVEKFGTYGTGVDQFSGPCGICTDDTYLYICDNCNNRIAKLDITLKGNGGGGTWSTFGTRGVGNVNFKNPYGICIDTTNNRLFITDTYNHRIKKYKTDGTYVSHMGGLASGNGNDQFYAPYGIAISVDEDHIVVADAGNYRIVKRTSADGLVYVAKKGSRGTGVDEFCSPHGVSIDEDDTNIYVTDQGWDGVSSPTQGRLMVRNFSDLEEHNVFPNSVAEWGGKAGTGDDQLYQPCQIHFEREYARSYYIADRWNHRIRRISLAENASWMYAGSTHGGNLIIPKDFAVGTHLTVAVIARSFSGQKKNVADAPSANIIVHGLGTPSDIEDGYSQYLGNDQYKIIWSRVADHFTHHYEVRRGSDWATSLPEALDVFGESVVVDVAAGAQVTFLVKGVSANGVTYSANEKSITTAVVNSPPVGGAVVGGNLGTG